jgi:hypothetical protein
MRALVVLAAVLCAGCATRQVQPAEYRVPLVLLNGNVEHLTVEIAPDDPGRVLFCVEFEDAVLCLAQEGGKAVRFYYPRLPPVDRFIEPVDKGT